MVSSTRVCRGSQKAWHVSRETRKNLGDPIRSCRKDAASGVDRVSAKEYEQTLEENIHLWVEDLKRKRYRAKRVLRRYIPMTQMSFALQRTLVFASFALKAANKTVKPCKAGLKAQVTDWG